MAAREPLVSVVIPTYNREGFLREAVASVFAQTFRDWELIVVDDGSTDGTRGYLATLSDTRVRMVESAHTGIPARVRNAGLARAAGRYVAFLDDDDLWMPEKLELQLADLAAHPERHWSYTLCTRIDERGAPVPPPPGRTWRPHAGWILDQVVLLDAWVAMPALLVERAVLRELGGFDESLLLCEDYDLYLRLARRWQASVLDVPLAAIRYHPGNNTGRKIEALEAMIELYRKLMGDAGAARVKWLARRQYARLAVDLAERHRGDRATWRALRALGRAFVTRPGYPRWWVALLKTLVRPLMPEPAMRLYRAVRGR